MTPRHYGASYAVFMCMCLSGCGVSAPELAPVLDSPVEGSDAYPFDGLDQLTLIVKSQAATAAVAERTVIFDDEDPQALSVDTIPFGDDWVVHLRGTASASELAYGRTCPVAIGADDSVVEPHLYFSRVVKWGAAAAAIDETQQGALSYVTPDGRAVVVGRNGPSRIAVFDANIGAFRLLQAQTVARDAGVLAAFSDGRAVLVGGTDTFGDAVTTFEVIDPDAGSEVLQVTTGDGPGLTDHTMTQLESGAVIVIGGRVQADAGGSFVVSGVAWQFRPGDGGVVAPPQALAESLQLPRASHASVRLGDDVGADVLVIGGLDSGGNAVAGSELFRPLASKFEALPSADLMTPRWDHFAVRMPGGAVLVGGGFTGSLASPSPVTTLEVFDPGLGQFELAGNLATGSGLSGLSVTPLPDGRILLAGGLDEAGMTTAMSSIARLDPLTGQIDVVPTASLHEPRAGHSAALLCDGTVLVTGGTSSTPLSDRYNPASEGRGLDD